MDSDYRVALLALRVIVDHERRLKGTIAHDSVVWTVAYQALNKCGYLDKPIPAQETSVTPAPDTLAYKVCGFCQLVPCICVSAPNRGGSL